MATERPEIQGSHFAVSTGHYYSSQAAFEVLQAGGNAVDAGVAAGLALGVLQSDLVSVAGVAPIILWDAKRAEMITISGLGGWPAAADIDYFNSKHGGAIPIGPMRTVVPSAPAAWIAALDRYGTMSFGDVAHYAVRFARDGFPMNALLRQTIVNNKASYEAFPYAASIYLPNDGAPPEVGELFFQKDLGASLQFMIDQEKTALAGGADRRQGLAAARAAFTELVITMRFDYDPIFCGTAAPFLSALAARQTQISTDTIPPEAETTSASVENLLPDTLAAYSGALIVPLCRDAALSQRGNQSLNEGAQVFTVTPPQFGSVLKMLSAKKVLLKLAIFAEENVAKLAYGEQNVYRSNTTRSRGFMVPVSALLAQRKKTPACHTKATVFVPRCFSALRKKDMVNAARVFFLSVTVVAVETYSLPTQDVSAVESVIAAIAKLVN